MAGWWFVQVNVPGMVRGHASRHGDHAAEQGGVAGARVVSVQSLAAGVDAGEASRFGSWFAVGWLLRVACALCFIGHGAWGIYQKPGWLPFYDVFAIPEVYAWMTMPLVGAHDIALGILVLVYPSRALLVWMGAWCLFTAALRPMAGMGWWEFFERGGNYAPPIALLVLSSGRPRLGWFDRIDNDRKRPGARRLATSAWVLRLGIAGLLIGHGAFAAFETKQYLAVHWAAIGVDLGSIGLRAVGGFEIVLGVAVLVTRSAPLLVAIAGWKVATELLYPISGGWMDTFEWVERSGDYIAPLALAGIWALIAHAGNDPSAGEPVARRGG